MNAGVFVTLALFFAGIVVGLPMAWVFLLSTVAGLLACGESLGFITGTAFHALNSYVLMAIAFFIFAGNVMGESGIADRIVRFSYALVGRTKGGLINVGIIATVFMSSLTGSSVPCIAALIPTLVPRLEKYGYQRVYSTAVLCSSSFLGYLIPPSVPVLIYCLVAGQSVAAVFLSTVIPGLILASGYMLVNRFVVHRYMIPTTVLPDLPTGFVASVKEIGSTGLKAFGALALPLIVLGGIYGGVFTPNEAGAIAVVYTLWIGFAVYKQLKRDNFRDVLKTTITTLGMITLLLAFGTVFTRFLIREGAAQALAQSMIGVFESRILILLMMNLLLLILGMFIDGIPILIVAVPLILPLVAEIGINYVQLGAIVVVNVGLGVVTPPYAISMFVGSRLGKVSYESLIRPMLMFLFAVGIPTLLLTTFVPWLSLWLPTLFVGAKIVGSW